MGTNYYTPYTDATSFEIGPMNAPLVELDKKITYNGNMIISCDGNIHYNPATGVLTWDDIIRVFFNTAAGWALENRVAAGNVTITDGQFIYTDITETDEAAITIAAADITKEAASNYIGVARLVLGYRNAASDEYVPLLLKSKTVDFMETFDGAPGASEIIMRVPMVRSVVFPVAMAGSQGILRTAATAETDFDIQKNTVSFGTMRFAIAGTVATFIAAATATFAAGDILEVIAPAGPDATAADLGINLTGSR